MTTPQQRKISECINVRINVGNYQHIEIVKLAEEQIEYSSDAERVQKEDQLTTDLVASITRSMKIIPEKLGKGIENAVQIEESIKKAIPEWLANGPVPNLANGARKLEVKVSADQKNEKDEQIKMTEKLAPTDAPVPVAPTSVVEEVLFEDDLDIGKSKVTAEAPKTEVKATKTTKQEVKIVKDTTFDDDDLFK